MKLVRIFKWAAAFFGVVLFISSSAPAATMKPFHLILLAGALLAGTAPAGSIFDADPSNVSLIDNDFNPGAANTITGSAGDLVFTQIGGQNNAAGFARAESINTLLGGALNATNAVVFTATLSSMTGDLLANGIEFGMSPNATGFRPDDNFLFKINAGGGGCIIQNNAFTAGGTSAGFGVTEASLYDGFGITLTVNSTNWTFALTDVILTSGTSATLSGSFIGTEFQDHFPEGHFYIASQKTASPDIVMNISEASIAVSSSGGGPPVVITPPVTYVVNSPDDQTQVAITESSGLLSYAVMWQGQTILTNSTLELFSGGRLRSAQVETSETNSIWKPVWGQFRQVRNQYEGLVLSLDADTGGDVVLECRVFNDGVGLRFTSGTELLDLVSSINFVSEYNFPENGKMYWANGEAEPAGPVSVSNYVAGSYTPKVPVVVDIADGAFAAVLESDLFSAELFSSMTFGSSSGESPALTGRSSATLGSGAWQTPWRVLLVGQTAGDLLTSTAPLNLAAECILPDTSWIKRGKTLWDWRVHGYETDGFTYGINTESYLRYIDFAATNNVQYFLIDANWYTAVANAELVASTNVDLTTIMAYADERDVGVLLYYDRKKGTVEDDVLFPQLAGLGAVGTKYGFMGNNAPFTRGAIAAAAESHLLINFHDSPCPMTGVERTLPNAVTREYCHAQQDSRKAFTPTAFLKMAMINALTGPLDQANGNFGLNGINAGEREKGPLILESYSSTVVSEAARVLVVSSGLICLPDAPEEYLKKADLFDFIRRMPATWGESRVINSAIGQNITTARRYGNEWFVGSVIDETGGDLSIPLDFLASNIVYDVTYYEDTADTHCVTNRESYQIRQGTVTRDDTITATLAPGGGHCMWIRPQKSLSLTEQGVSITWDSSEEETYRIDRTGMLVSNHWNAVASNEVEGIWTDTSAETKTAENLFYRILPEAN